MKRGIIILAIFVFLVGSVFVVAKPGANNDVGIPPHAVQVADNVFSLGQARDVDGRIVEGFLFVHDNRRENAKPDGLPGGGNGGGKDKGGSTCFSLFAKGARWKTTEQYITNGVNLTLTERSLNTWDSEVSFDIFGVRNASGVVDSSAIGSLNYQNEVMFENLGSGNTIAYAVVWGIFGGPPSQRELVEWDVVFNTYYFGDSQIMDYQNIATHEFGHALGLGHPDSTCTEETMYAYASAGETKKRSLEAGDIAGINKLY